MDRIIRLFVLVAATALLLGACGDDDTSTEAGAPEDEAEDAAEDVLEDELGSGCGFLGKFAGTGFDQAVGLDPTSALSDGGEAFTALAEEFREVADAAPDDIQDQFQTMADGMADMAEVFSEIDLSDPSNIDPTAFEQFEDGPGADFESAAEEVDAWIRDNCEGAGGG